MGWADLGGKKTALRFPVRFRLVLEPLSRTQVVPSHCVEFTLPQNIWLWLIRAALNASRRNCRRVGSVSRARIVVCPNPCPRHTSRSTNNSHSMTAWFTVVLRYQISPDVTGRTARFGSHYR